jgi:hypothetical protein
MTYDKALEIWCRRKFPNAPKGGFFFLENCAGGEHGPDVYLRWAAGPVVTKKTVTTTALWRLSPEYTLQAVMREVFAISGSPESSESAAGNDQ